MPRLGEVDRWQGERQLPDGRAERLDGGMTETKLRDPLRSGGVAA
ncbi:hypothetical protein [Streptomyces mobaraensis]|nr:hypothetical protein [Streptomyces mobaraensis]